LPGLAVSSSSAPATALEGPTVIGGFNGILGEEALNRHVFESCLAGRLRTVLSGGTVSLFCYGYTGSGKTHTAIGYGEPGVYRLAAEHLLGGVSTGVFIHATALEVYNDEVYDLLGEEAVRCTLRVDSDGQLQVTGPPTQHKLPPEESGILEGVGMEAAHATIATKPSSLRSVSIQEAADLDRLTQGCVQRRAVGSSTEHKQSSRSHALLRLELVSEAVLAARAAVHEAAALLPARKNALDNCKTGLFTQLFVGQRQVLRPEGEVPSEEEEVLGIALGSPGGGLKVLRPGDLVVEAVSQDGELSVAGTAMTLQGWQQHLHLPGLQLCRAVERKPREDWQTTFVELQRKQVQMQCLVDEAEAKLQVAEAKLAEVLASGPPQVGGCLYVVDLAGADYDHRAGGAQKESAAINKSLLALKECFRSLAGVGAQKPNFRQCKLTRLLEDALCPAASSQRRNRESLSVMLVNVSPEVRLEKMTVNTLRYGQLYAASGPSLRKQRPEKGQDDVGASVLEGNAVREQ